MARIRVIDQPEADGELAEIYQELTKSRGKLAEVHKIQSLNPQSIRDHMALYTTTMFARSPLPRAEREMIAVVVSATNGCRYCIAHHGEALLHFWKDPERVDRLARDRTGLTGLSEREALLCRYAEAVTREPGSDRVGELVDALRKTELDDRAILDATLVVSYFNFVNRVVLAMGVELEQDAGGYVYEQEG
jgi:uncharacterized peroxidase-related enzyme